MEHKLQGSIRPETSISLSNIKCVLWQSPMAINMFKPDVILKGKDSSESPLPKSFLERYIGGLSTGFSSILGYYLSKIWKQHSNLAWGTSVFQFLWNGLKFSFSHSFLFLFLMHAYVHLRYTNIRLFHLQKHCIISSCVSFIQPSIIELYRRSLTYSTSVIALYRRKFL